jgi:hypothetical protein
MQIRMGRARAFIAILRPSSGKMTGFDGRENGYMLPNDNTVPKHGIYAPDDEW